MLRTNRPEPEKCALCGEKFLEGNNFPRYRTSRTIVFRLYKGENAAGEEESFLLKGKLDGKCVKVRLGSDDFRQFQEVRHEPPVQYKYH